MHRWSKYAWLLAWAVPTALVLLVVELVPGGGHGLMGISIKSWLLFACSPLASLCLLLAYAIERAGS